MVHPVFWQLLMNACVCLALFWSFGTGERCQMIMPDDHKIISRGWTSFVECLSVTDGGMDDTLG